ncbi:MAG: lipoprotein insertase outer membrane protein LolB [Chromatiaceae bacterium]|nr:lipoprotein insertase outer membrane protein LolB [Chromatiaceae bacterium]
MYEKAQPKKSTVKDFSVVYAFLRPLLSGLLLLLVTGCSLLQPTKQAQAPLSVTEREQQLLEMQQFELQASVGIKSQADSISGNLRWQQHSREHFHARLSNFLGISLFELTDDGNLSSISVKGETYQAADTSTLLWQLAGWSMPLQDMPLYLRGLPGKRGRNIVRDEFDRVTAFELTDSTGIVWQLSYQRFFPDALALPQRLLLQSSDSEIKIVIRSWQ